MYACLSDIHVIALLTTSALMMKTTLQIKRQFCRTLSYCNDISSDDSFTEGGAKTYLISIKLEITSTYDNTVDIRGVRVAMSDMRYPTWLALYAHKMHTQNFYSKCVRLCFYHTRFLFGTLLEVRSLLPC